MFVSEYANSDNKEHGVTVGKTALGAQVMKDRSMGLTPQQRSALILCDGKRSVDEVVKLTSAAGVSMADIDKLMELGLIERGSSAATAGVSAALPTQPVASSLAAPTALTQVAAPALTTAEAGLDFPTAHNAAITLCSDLGFKGFGLNMALTGVDSMEKLQKLAPEIRRAAGDAKYKALHLLIFGKSL